MANRKYANAWQAKKAERAVHNAYQKRAMTAYTFRFHNKNDADIIAKLETVDNRLGFIKEAIRKAIEEEKHHD